MNTQIEQVKQYLLDLQNRISSLIIEHDPTISLTKDHWNRSEGGGGDTRAFSEGVVFEKVGVNFSHVWGEKLPDSATKLRPELVDKPFQAIGLSVIMHPLNPYAPTSHANLRLFSAELAAGQTIWWFGGGFDLTPYYGFEEDCIHWHQTAKRACDPFGEELYYKYKTWADKYFFIKHRDEPRGIGGIFFDDLNSPDFSTCFSFLKRVGNHYIDAYFPIIKRRATMPYTQKERDFQLYRRGRYVEFNLVYDRGTLFGLQSGGRTESILISLPPLVAWHYNLALDKESPEHNLYEKFLKPRDWANEK